MSRRVRVEHPDGWVQGDDTAVTGTAFVDGRRHDAAALHDRFARVDDRASFRRAIDSLTGFYAVVRVLDGTVLAATDHVRSVPLFYAPSTGLVSDSARWLRGTLAEPTIDAVAEAEYLTTTYVTGRETLYDGIRTVRAGEIVALDADAASDANAGETRRYDTCGARRHGSGTVRSFGTDRGVDAERHWTYAPSAAPDDPDGTPTDRLAAFDDALVAAFERLLAVADGRPIAVPLSGGLDSRLVATMLVRLDADDVLAFTYGRPDSADVRIAERVADALDLPWRHVPYAADDWRDWFDSRDRAAYYERVDDFDAIPNLSAWPAVRELLAEGWLPSDAVVVPGQTVAEIAGHLPDRLLGGDATTAAAVESVLDRHYCQSEYDDDLARTFAARVRGVVDGVCDPTSAYAAWEWQERHAKFLCSDGRIYEHGGLDWWFPLWDPAVARAWGAFPAAARADKRRYAEFVETLYADTADVDRAAAGRTQVDESRLAAGVRRAKRAVEASPLSEVVRPLYRRYRARTVSREAGPFALFGIVPPEQFDRLYAADRTHHGFRALEAVGRVSFTAAEEPGWPGDTLSTAALDRTRPGTDEGATTPATDTGVEAAADPEADANLDGETAQLAGRDGVDGRLSSRSYTDRR